MIHNVAMARFKMKSQTQVENLMVKNSVGYSRFLKCVNSASEIFPLKINLFTLV